MCHSQHSQGTSVTFGCRPTTAEFLIMGLYYSPYQWVEGRSFLGPKNDRHNMSQYFIDVINRINKKIMPFSHLNPVLQDASNSVLLGKKEGPVTGP